MRVAIVGSRTLTISNLGDYLPPDTTEIISGGARGIDACARAYAQAHGIKLVEHKPNYSRYLGGAPKIRNERIIAEADLVLAFWDGQSRGTAYVIKKCRSIGKPVKIFVENKKEKADA